MNGFGSTSGNADVSRTMTPANVTPAFAIPESKRLSRIFRQIAELPSLLLVDLIAVGLAYSLAFIMRQWMLPTFSGAFAPTGPYLKPGQVLGLSAIVTFFLAYEGLYQRRMAFWQEARRVTRANFVAMAVTLAVLFASKTGASISRPFLFLFWINLLWAIPMFRYWGKAFLTSKGLWRRDILILGAGRTGAMLVKTFNEDPSFGYRPVGFLDDYPDKQGKVVTINGQVLPVYGSLAQVDAVMERLGLRDVAVAIPGLKGPGLVELVNGLQGLARNVLVVPDLFGLPVVGLDVDYLYNQQAVVLNVHNHLADGFNVFLKRLFDLTLAVLLLPLLLPVMAIIALVIKLDSHGPVIHTDLRVGKNGRRFKCYKFRSMVLNNDTVLQDYLNKDATAREEWDRFMKLKKYDPRLTRVGRLLRRWSLDELPQVFNVIKGEMSLVGPRPYLPRELPRMESYLESILLAAPGITGLWQVSGRNEAEFEERMQLDVWYTRNWSLWLDMVLLFKTIGVVAKVKGAY